MADEKPTTGKTELRQVQADLRSAEERAETRSELDELSKTLTDLIFAHRSEWRGLLMRGVWLLALASLVTVGASAKLGWDVSAAWALLEHRVEMLEPVAPHR